MLLWGASDAGTLGNPWPVVAVQEKRVQFTAHESASLDWNIRGTDGNALYRLMCHRRDFERDPEFTYSADFECRLKSLYSRNLYSTLLTDDYEQKQDWESRAGFDFAALVGACARYPEYGLVRDFLLRGMRLTLELLPLKLQPDESGTPKQFGVVAKVEPSSVVSAIALPAPYARPQGDCNMITEQHVRGYISQDYVRENHLGPPYPPVASLLESISVPNDLRDCGPEHPFQRGSRANICIAITDRSGHPIYELLCISGGPGGMACMLSDSSMKLDLLEDAVDLYSRAPRSDFAPEQLYSDCANYPGWGASRQFRLRGMKLTLALKDISFGKAPEFFMGGLRNYKFTVQVERDAMATAPVAVPISYVDWRFKGWAGYPVPDSPAVASKDCKAVLTDPPAFEGLH